MHTTNDIRTAFLDYFKKNAHEVVSSASLVPTNDPTLLFTNAGMVPFKNVFTGDEHRSYVRATSSQKCVRAGGKHNDLDNVGYTARHHTFFEMLGNFSFGDYFKDGAIELAWNLITKEFGLDKERLLVTVYAEDDEAFDLWRKIAGLSEHKIIRIPTSDNFWSMGDTGPCGPCSEIFYDHGDHIAGGPPGSPDEDGDRFVEIWNLVFMQFDQQADGSRLKLPKPSIDTGMGLERIAAVMQGTHDNYETDLFKRLIEASVKATGADETDKTRPSHRVIADHLRSCSFLIADGVLPSNEGRGYVLRRIMRRALRHAHMLGARDLVMHKLPTTLIAEMGNAYPELKRAENLIVETLKLEETRFRKMLETGLKLLEDEMSKLPEDTDLPGDVAFRLYDTYGFPLDLTQDALRSMDRGVDEAGFRQAMEAQRAKARAAWKGSGDTGTDSLWFEIDDQYGATEFVGYASNTSDALVQVLIRDGESVMRLDEGESGILTVNQTPFYGESGGQMGDTGTVSTDSGGLLSVDDTQKMLGKIHTHYVKVTKGYIAVGQTVHMTIDHERRRALKANHSATHVLHEVLRRQLGDHVTQKGSLVAPDRLRFDISHPKAISFEQLQSVEEAVNQVILNNDAVVTRLLPYDQALDAGALALFGEKYGDEVRVVAMGGTDCMNMDKDQFSVELCGGTHVARLGDIGLFVITSESAVSAGVRRLEAMTGEAARKYLDGFRKGLRSAADVVKCAPEEVVDRMKGLLGDKKALELALVEARKKAALGGSTAGPEIQKIGAVNYLGEVLNDVSPKELRSLADEAKKRLKSGVIAFVAVNDGKAAVLVSVTKDLTDRLNAVELVKRASVCVGGGGGGGRPDMAQAGGPDGDGAHKALEAIEEALKSSE